MTNRKKELRYGNEIEIVRIDLFVTFGSALLTIDLHAHLFYYLIYKNVIFAHFLNIVYNDRESFPSYHSTTNIRMIDLMNDCINGKVNP